MHHLIVVHEFGNYAKGHKITDQDEVDRVLASPQHTNVVKIAAPEQIVVAAAETGPLAPVSLIDQVE